MKSTSIILTVLVCMLCISLLGSSCSSPAIKGKRLASQENEVYENGKKQLNDLKSAFTVNFNPKKYTSRSAAQNDFISKREAIVRKMEKDVDSLQRKKDEFEEGSIRGVRSGMRFIMAYEKCKNRTLESEMKEVIHDILYERKEIEESSWRRTDPIGDSIPMEVLRAISKIVSAKPDENRIKQELQKRTLNNVAEGYYSSSDRKVIIVNYDITDFKILEGVKESASVYIANVSMTLVGKENDKRRFSVLSRIRFVLPAIDDWTIDLLNTSELTPVNDKEYMNSVTAMVKTKAPGYGCASLYVRNLSDKPLEVYIRYYDDGELHREIVNAEPMEDKNVRACFDGSDFNIDYVLPLGTKEESDISSSFFHFF